MENKERNLCQYSNIQQGNWHQSFYFPHKEGADILSINYSTGSEIYKGVTFGLAKVLITQIDKRVRSWFPLILKNKICGELDMEISIISKTYQNRIKEVRKSTSVMNPKHSIGKISFSYFYNPPVEKSDGSFSIYTLDLKMKKEGQELFVELCTKKPKIENCQVFTVESK